jgi:exopolyphosphatase/guanosine-5'-triphosphate,3'-diphosphate pyrophosphatase
LEGAAYLHDIGHYVSDVAHHKHSHYLVVNSDMPGFTKAERTMIAMLCRYHRKAMPAAHHEAYQELNAESRKAIMLLAPLLRIADSLDRSHEQRVEEVSCQIKNGNVVVQIQAEADTDLEQWAGERAADVFREVYNRSLSLVKAK